MPVDKRHDWSSTLADVGVTVPVFVAALCVTVPIVVGGVVALICWVTKG